MWPSTGDLADTASLSVRYFLTAFVVSAIVAFPILRALLALKSRQTIYDLAPATHQKKQGTPTMGGIIILVGAFVAVLIADIKHWPIVAWMIGFSFIGFGDDFLVPRLLKDKRGLGWKQKIIGQVALSLLVAIVFNFDVHGTRYFTYSSL